MIQTEHRPEKISRASQPRCVQLKNPRANLTIFGTRRDTTLKSNEREAKMCKM
jgi:hypothetical protein